MSNIHSIQTHPSPARRQTRRTRDALAVAAARQLRDTQHLMDQALAGQLSLGQMLLTGRLETGFAAAVGQDVLADLSTAFAQAVQSRAALVSAHAAAHPLPERT
jgi:hypothetical protein